MTAHLRSMAPVMSAFLINACATTMNVSSHVERGLDFGRYHTYEWGPADALPTGDPRLDQNPFFKDHLQGAVEKQLAAKGFERSDSGSPDLLIHYHASINERVKVDRFDRPYGYCYTDDCEAGVSYYKAGTLVLDIVDPRTNRVIWRGWAQDSVEDALKDRDKMARKIDDSVARMLKMLPQGLER